MDEPRTSYASERLIMRPWRNDEADRLLDIRSRRGVVRWLSDPDPWTDVATAQQAIAGWAHRRPPLGVWAIVPKAAGVPAGTVSLGLLPDGDEVEIGWYLHPDSQGRGYAREAARAALRHALANGVCRVWAVMWPHNAASARVATAIGMTDLGVRHDPWYGTPDEPDSRMFHIDRTPEGPPLVPPS